MGREELIMVEGWMDCKFVAIAAGKPPLFFNWFICSINFIAICKTSIFPSLSTRSRPLARGFASNKSFPGGSGCGPTETSPPEVSRLFEVGVKFRQVEASKLALNPALVNSSLCPSGSRSIVEKASPLFIERDSGSRWTKEVVELAGDDEMPSKLT
jgi:hypothetical protein